jgi:hypothetical protein
MIGRWFPRPRSSRPSTDLLLPARDGSSSTLARLAGATRTRGGRVCASRGRRTSRSSESPSSCCGQVSRWRCTTGKPIRKIFSCSPARPCSSSKARNGRCDSGDTPCTVLAVGAREHQTTRAADGTLQWAVDWGGYAVDEAALRHGAGVEEETTDEEQAYARFPKSEPTRYRDGWLSG